MQLSGSLQASPQAPGQTTGVVGARVASMAEIENLVERLEMAVVRLETVSSKFHGSALPGGDIVNGVDGDLAPCVEAYDALLSVAVAEYLKNSKAIGEDVEKHAEMVNAAFQAQRGFVKLASTHQQPPESEKKQSADSTRFQGQRVFVFAAPRVSAVGVSLS
ncbi:UNVERIFIED_CONTAM: hypothetical protein FKN15_045834 [Acipenser sinensis]